ncbi:hypothetical protein E0L29_11005 [Chlorobium sp. N1]|nr:hypothetical protein E0L29_11005 [Chlorobium sp. N1]
MSLQHYGSLRKWCSMADAHIILAIFYKGGEDRFLNPQLPVGLSSSTAVSKKPVEIRDITAHMTTIV